MKSFLPLAAAILLLTACTQPTRLENPATDQVVTCWNPLYEVPLYAALAPGDPHDCVRGYLARGYMKMPDDGVGL